MYFITIPANKEQFKNRLTKVRTDGSGWIKYFYDKEADAEWVEYYPYEVDRAPSILKRTDLKGSIEEIINVCLLSNDIEDWRGLGAELSSGKYHITDIAKVLRENAYRWPDKALKEFKKYFSPIDRRNIVGMKIDEVNKSYNEFISSKKEIDEIIK
ncbi:hypothetical protein D770_05005 [Flammeovirgaceae bacterium 311]|nr:hypothetical protein D770_05005 [Flammeovirgaceae bacterium 311]